ncbi:MAG: DUF4200 domain-containing protein [Prevotella sp.]|nr:DUF4200 domain-containing protein [Prevotella sp.]
MAYNIFGNDKQQNYPGTQQPEVSVATQSQQTGGQAQQQAGANAPGTVAGEGVAVVQPQTERPQRRAVGAVDPTSSTSGMDAVSSMLTTPQQEEKIRRASIANQRIMALGDALRHVGNIYHTVNYAPSQKFNSPVTEEYERYQKGKAVRDAANLKYYTYQQQKAAQDARAKQWETEANYQNESLKLRRAQHDRLMKAQDLAIRKEEFLEELKNKQLELDRMAKEHKITIDQYNAESRRLQAQAAYMRAEKYVPGGAGVGGYETITETENHYDENGRRTGQTTKRTRTGSHKENPYGNDGNSNNDHRNNPYG